MEERGKHIAGLIEELAANAWPARFNQHVCGWRLRHTPGTASRRVNSVLAENLAAGIAVEDLIGMCEAFYADRGSPPRFQISPAVVPPDLDALLERRGYAIDAATSMFTASVEAVIERSGEAGCSFAVETSQVLSDEWLDCFHRIGDRREDDRQMLADTFRRIAPRAFFGLAREAGSPLAVAVAVVERGWGGLFSFATAVEHRRRGAASGLLRALTQRCRDCGAERLYLQVLVDNAPAIRFYRRFGFTPAYRYHFRWRPGPASQY
jgi:ribosomal protein S18 acetylase RimI-like enzyme